MFKAQDQGSSALSRATAASQPLQAPHVGNSNRRNLDSGRTSDSSYQLSWPSQPTTPGSHVKAPNRSSNGTSGSNSSVGGITHLNVDARRRTAEFLEDGPKFEYERNSFPDNIYVNTPLPDTTLQSLTSSTSTPPNPPRLRCRECNKIGFKDKSKLE